MIEIMKKVEISTRILTFVIAALLFVVFFLAFLFYEEKNKLEGALNKQISEGYYISDHIGEEPVFIFSSKEVLWKELAPKLDDIYGIGVKKQVLGSFPVPHNYGGTDISTIKSNSQKLIFPEYGRYYLHTTIGFFKILLLDPQASQDEKI